MRCWPSDNDSTGAFSGSKRATLFPSPLPVLLVHFPANRHPERRDVAYWLLKTEPDCYNWDDLARDKSDVWDGVTNPVAVPPWPSLIK